MVSKGWIKRLFKEINNWVDEKIIDPHLAEILKSKYSKQLEYNRLLSAIFILGSILIGLGILLFIASNWQYLGKPFKIGLIFSLILIFNFLGYNFRYEKGNHVKLGEAFLFLGAISYGAGIWLIAQIFQIPYKYANGLLFWFLGILPLVFLLRSGQLLILASLILPVWWFVFLADTNFKSVGYSLLPLAGLVLYCSYRQRQRTSLIISLLVGALWLWHYFSIHLEGLPYPYIYLQSLYNNLFIAYGFFLYALGIAHERSFPIPKFSIVYKLLGIISIFFNNYLLTFVHHWKYFSAESEKMNSLYSMPPAGYVIYLFYFGAVLLTLRWKKEIETKALFSFLILQLVFLWLPLNDLWTSVTYNILLFAQIITFLYLGYLLREELIFRMSFYWFGLYALTRYLDSFWKILPRSLFFLLGGLILIGGGIYMEKKRKDIEKKMKKGSDL